MDQLVACSDCVNLASENMDPKERHRMSVRRNNKVRRRRKLR